MPRKINQKGISPKVIGRLSLYRRALQNLSNKNITHLFSQELADLANVTCSQVRQDIMGIGYKGSPQFGYEIEKLQQAITRRTGSDDMQKLVLLGGGHLGKAILQFFQQTRPNIKLVSTFEIDKDLIGGCLNDVPIRNIDQMENLVIEEGIHLAILAVPSRCAQEMANRLTAAGVRSILNLTASTIRVPAGVFVENNDISVSLERMAFYGSRTHEVK